MTIGDNIKKYRKEKKLTQKELGEMINRSTISIRKYESGSIKPSIDVLHSLTKALNVTVYDLVTEDNIDQVDFELSALEGFTRELIPGTSYHNLTDDEKKQVEKVHQAGTILFELIEDKELHTVVTDAKELELFYHNYIEGLNESHKIDLEYKDHLISIQNDRIKKLEDTINKAFNLLGGDTDGE